MSRTPSREFDRRKNSGSLREYGLGLSLKIGTAVPANRSRYPMTTFILLLCCLVIFLHGPDKLSIDHAMPNYLAKKVTVAGE